MREEWRGAFWGGNVRKMTRNVRGSASGYRCPVVPWSRGLVVPQSPKALG